MPVYLSDDCMGVVRSVFGYLFPKPAPAASAGAAVFQRHVSAVDWRRIAPLEPFVIADLAFTPLPVWHGEDLLSLGFMFGRTEKVCYLSDISRMPQETLAHIQSCGPVHLLVVDALCLSYQHPTHFSLQQAVELCQQIRPKVCRFVGMASEFDHEKVNEQLRLISARENIDMQLSYDGLCIKMEL